VLILEILAWLSITLGGLATLIIYVDIQMGRFQKLGIMNIAWPLTALFLWPVVLYVYFRYGRATSSYYQKTQAESRVHKQNHDHSHCHSQKHQHHSNPAWVDMYISGTHCASGCSAADIISETGIYILGITIAGSFLWAGFVIDYGMALLFGLVFQYYSIKPLRPDLTFKKGIWQAFKADVLSLTSFQLGMYTWMLISVYFIFNETINAGDPIFWWMMQIAMALGTLTTMPVNRWLVKVGIKHHCH
jgi:hypothetical protein